MVFKHVEGRQQVEKMGIENLKSFSRKLSKKLHKKT